MISMHSRKRSARTATPVDIRAGLGGEELSDIFARRIEADRSWTVYHAFTGVPAVIAGRAVVGLSRQAATDRMLAMNRVERGRRMDRMQLKPPRLDAREIGALRWR
jgi:hypothetical protein